MSKIGVYPGSFDPVTFGHLDIIKRSLNIFDELIVAVLENPRKKTIFTLDERLELLNVSLKDAGRIKIYKFSGLLVDFMQKHNANVIIRGLRVVSDYEYEYQMALLNNKLNHSMDTIFLMAHSQFAFLSSTNVRELASLGGSIKDMVPEFVEKKIKEKFKKNKNDRRIK